MMTVEEREAQLESIGARIRNCTRCKLHKERTQAVPGTGPVDADVVFIGEGPGAREDEEGLPFVGRSGRYLDQLLEGIGLDRETVFITNVVKCRPPGNRDPHVAEVEACTPHLDQQLRLIQPRLVVTLGRFAMEHFFSDRQISEVHGQPRRIDGRIHLPLYHPAAALYRGSLREPVEQDFQTIPRLLRHPKDLPVQA
jgi:DNA polymerase